MTRRLADPDPSAAQIDPARAARDRDGMNRFTAAVAKAAPAATREFPLPGIFIGSDKPVVLHCVYAGWSNPGVTDAMVTSRAARAVIEKMPDGHARLVAGARVDIPAYRFAIVSWDNVVEHGTPLAVTPELAGELLTALVDQHISLFMRWKSWVGEPDNFVDTPIGDPVDLGK